MTSMRKMKKQELSLSMTETQFDNGYWYATELKAFAVDIGIPAANKLRKDELEKAIKVFLRTREITNPAERSVTKTGMRDVDKGLRLDLPVVHYTSNRETKEFILREAQKIDPTFQRKSGTRYLLNRWREAQLQAGKPITYGDLVQQAIAFNQEKEGPLRIEHARYINFLSDFMAAHPKATKQQALAAWKELKQMDVLKTYSAWASLQKK